MAIQLGISNSLKSLSDRLAEKLRDTKSVFQPVYIVTQTAGMNIWLKQQLAQKLGIAANIQFLKPNDAIHLLFQKLSGFYQFNSLSAHDLNWIIFDVLNEEEFKNRFEKIAEYYNQPGLEGEIKRMALAEKIADLFDQYQIYRAPEIEQWNNKEDWEILKVIRNETDQEWQKHIWNRARKMAGEHFSDKTYIGKHILNKLNEPEAVEILQQEVPALYFFGLSLITDYHLQIIYKVSEFIDVEFLFQNPAPWQYWYDDKSEKIVDFLKRIGKYGASEKAEGNPLLTSWGKLTQNTFKMFFSDDDTLNTLQDFGVEEPEKNSLLHNIQNSIFNNEKEEISFSNNQIKDGTVTINSCYSPIREVEVLYNYLVHLVDQKNEKLSARDIIVMVSDIDLYGSYIKAVFDNAPYKFPYTIADESFVVSDTISNALTGLLSINENQFTSEKVVGLLEFESIRKQFRIENVEIIRKAIRAANIRFGFTGNPEFETQYVSWEYGLNRMMYGLTMFGGNEYGQGKNSIYPIDIVEGFDMFNIVRFVHFVRVLKNNIQSRSKNRTITDWVEYVQNTLITFIGEIDENPDEDYVLLQNQLNQYNRLKAFFEKEVEYEVFKYNFLPTLANARRSNNFASYGITFCSLIPMRSIPFKVVALLGMDLQKFPRMNRPVSFDLIEKKKQTGDRDLKENDKQLFLDTLLSAEDYFYLSYVGQSVKDNEEIPASALVDEFVDFIAVHAENPDEIRESFVQKHPLHGFSKKYNTRENPELYSYLLNSSTDSEKPLGEKRVPEFNFKEIELSSVLSFFRNPARAYYQRVLNCYFTDDILSLEEYERFELEFLEKYSIRASLVSSAIEVSDEYLSEQKKKGHLPLKNMAHTEMEQLLKENEAIQQVFNELTGDLKPEEIIVNLEIDDSQLRGRVNKVYGENLIYYTLSNSANKHRLGAYIEYLTLVSQGFSGNLFFIDNAGGVVKAVAISGNEARKILTEIIEIYKKGHEKLMPFHFEFSVMADDAEAMTQEEFEIRLLDYLKPTQYGHRDVYIQKALGAGEFQKNGVFEAYKNIAAIISDIVVNQFQEI